MRIIKNLILIFILHLSMNVIVFANATDESYNEIVFSVNKNMICIPKSYKNGIYVNSNNIVSNDLKILLNRYNILYVSKAFQEISPDDSIRFTSNGRRFNINFLNNVFIIKLNKNDNIKEFIYKMKNISGIGFVENNNIKGELCGDPNYSNQWYLKNTGQFGGKIGADIKIEPVWQFWTGNNSKVAVIDAGVLSTHSELEFRVVGDEPCTGTNMTNCLKYHGTRVAGIIGAIHNNDLIKGVNPNVQIISKNIFDYKHELLTATEVAQKIMGAVNDGAEVLNFSWKIPKNVEDQYFNVIRFALRYAYYHNRTCVCAMGNNDGNISVIPAGFGPEIIAVGSSTDQDQRSDFSNYQNYIDIVAPGGYQGETCIENDHNIFSISGPNNNSYSYDAGTSYSAPQVTGVASLMKSYKPELYNDDIQGILQYSADDIGDPGWDQYTGYGRLNANNAMNLLKSPYIIERGSTIGGIENTPPSDWYIKFIYSNEHQLEGRYNVKRHIIKKSISFSPKEFVKVWGRGIETTGWGMQNPQFNIGFCGVLPNSLTNNSVTLYTYIYEVRSADFNTYLGYFPCQANETVFAYSILSGPPQLPNISSISQTPIPLRPGGYSTFTCNFVPGGGTASQYLWSITNNSGLNITHTSPTLQTFTITWNTSDIFSKVKGNDKYIKISCTASNSYGNSSKSVLTYYSSNNGCPWLIVTDQDTNIQFENNLLNKSQLPENQGNFITDKYILKTKPGIFDDKIKLDIVETSIDSSIINRIKLYSVIHPLGTKLGITANNEIVYYDSASVIQNDIASLYDSDYGYTDITSDLQFHNQNRSNSLAQGDSLYHIFAEYKNQDIINPAIITFMKRGILDPITPIAKDNFSGNLFVNTPVGTSQFPFMRRENPDDVILPLTGKNLLGSVDSIHIAWDKSFKIDYAAIASLNYIDFSVSELPLVTAFHTSDGDVLQNLLYLDSGYSYVSPNAYLNLEFSISPSMVPQVKTDYVLEINGQVIFLGSNKMRSTKVTNPNQNTIPDKYSLSQNYPNPFNPVTKINFSIPKQGFVTLKIYDILGREVRTLVNETKQPGNYSVDFNGSSLASGVYFYRLESNSFTSIKRMVLIK
jgi:hypothetical protein